MQRSLVAAAPAAVLTVLGLSGVALAAPPVPGLAPLPAPLSARCARLAETPPSARISTPAFAAHVSVANCVLEEAMNKLALSPNDKSIAKLNAAVTPGVAILDNVAAVGDPYWKMIAADAKRDLYVGMVVRMRSSIPGADLAAHDALEPKLVTWLDTASHEAASVAALAHANPQAASRDPVVAGIVQRTAATTTAVANRPQRSRT